MEWETPWGSRNLVLWNLYKESSGQGECPMVIDETTPSCGNSRFGCWTCTVVTKDRAMESLIQNGEVWMEPLLKFRNILARSTSPKLKKKYRNHIRRDGRLAFKTLTEDGEKILTDDYTTGPYLLKYRKLALRLLLKTQKQLSSKQKDMELITVPELHAVRHEWLNDPNEPDWDDSLPQIFRDVFGFDLDWSIDDTNQFSQEESKLINRLAPEFDVSAQMVKKLINLEISMSGLSRRVGIFQKIGRLVQQDWESADTIIKQNKQGRQNQISQSAEIRQYEGELNELDALLKKETEELAR
jgi:DNA sulfur modification protein DndC